MTKASLLSQICSIEDLMGTETSPVVMDRYRKTRLSNLIALGEILLKEEKRKMARLKAKVAKIDAEGRCVLPLRPLTHHVGCPCNQCLNRPTRAISEAGR